jgi:O-antigen/teichoic acid export membrane protein
LEVRETGTIADTAPTPSAGATMRVALVWNAANLVANQLAGATIFFILARQLPPAVFGVLALALIYTEFFTQQGASALRDALIQRRDFSAHTLSTVFWAALGCAALAAAIGAVGAPFAAHAFDAPSLVYVLPALSLSILLSPATTVMEAQVVRHLQFRALAMRNIAAVWIGGLVGLAVVFSPYAEWALVAQRLAQMAFSFIFLFFYTRWAPTFAFSRPLAVSYAQATWQLWVTQIISVMGLQFANLAIGWRLGPDMVGIMRVARKFIEIIHASITSAVMSMWVPLLSRIATDVEARGEMFLKLMQFAAMICIPPMIGLSLVSRELTALLLDSRYGQTGPALAILGITGVFVPLTYFRSAVLAAMSRNSLSMKVALFDLTLVSAAVFWFSQYGLQPALLSILAAAGITTAVSAYFTVTAVGVTPASFVRAIAPAYLGVLAMAAAVLAVSPLVGTWHMIPALALKAGVGVCAYLGWLTLNHRAWLMTNVRFVLERH